MKANTTRDSVTSSDEFERNKIVHRVERATAEIFGLGLIGLTAMGLSHDDAMRELSMAVSIGVNKINDAGQQPGSLEEVTSRVQQFITDAAYEGTQAGAAVQAAMTGTVQAAQELEEERDKLTC